MLVARASHVMPQEDATCFRRDALHHPITDLLPMANTPVENHSKLLGSSHFLSLTSTVRSACETNARVRCVPRHRQPRGGPTSDIGSHPPHDIGWRMMCLPPLVRAKSRRRDRNWLGCSASFCGSPQPHAGRNRRNHRQVWSIWGPG